VAARFDRRFLRTFLGLLALFSRLTADDVLPELTLLLRPRNNYYVSELLA